MEVKDIYEIWDRFDLSQTSKLELDMHGVHLILEKNGGASAVAKSDVISTSKSEPLHIEETRTDNVGAGTPITAPIVGTFYRAPSEDAKPFVEEGQIVKEGDVVGIIEAMKLMNEITAPRDGRVSKINVENGSIVEFNQVLIQLD